MPATVRPLFLKSATITVDGDPVEGAVSNVTITPTTTALSFKAVNGVAYQDQSGETWAAALTYAQDWTTPGSLARTLFDRAGESVELVFTPSTGGPTITVDATLVAGAIGGEVDAAATATVTLPVTGRPVIGDAPAPAAA